MALNFNVEWIHGARDCRQSPDPILQTHQADEQTFIFRQSKCSSFEAPFMYLLVGRTRSLLIDTGAPTAGEVLPIRTTVDQILSPGNGTADELIVAHSHAHADHAAWDRQFATRPRTTIVPLRQSGIQAQFGIAQWPEGSGSLDLGGRTLTVMPLPGHEPLHIAIHDSRTDLLLTGDTLYPGLLVANQWQAYRASARRLAAFARSRTISCALGAHIEIDRSGRLFNLGTTFQPNEHPLQLVRADLDRWTEACEDLGPNPSRGMHEFTNFVIDVRG